MVQSIPGAYSFGIDARVGAIVGEHCPGGYSVSAQGHIKLAGVVQRITRCGYHLGAVISVLAAEHAKAAVAETYLILSPAFAAKTFGALADVVPDPSSTAVTRRRREALAEKLSVTQQSAAA